MKKIGVLGLLVALGVIGTLFYIAQSWGGAGPLERDVEITVPQGATLTRTADTLEQARVISSASRFLLLSRVLGNGSAIRAGEYAMPAGISQADVLRMLQEGRALQRLVTIPEGTPAVLVHERLMAEPLLTGEIAVPREGSVLPDSYSFERGDSRQQVLDRMQRAMTDYLAAAWEKRQPGTIARTPEETIILASIVEKETSVPAERRTVAAVYTNRLRIGMPLQADPTVIYPLTQGRPLGRRIRRSELQARNGYNTYAEAGLPRGPIANPGRAAIDAVLDPNDSEALYFVADGTGGHIFANTLPEHNANVQKWYAIRRARGEM